MKPQPSLTVVTQEKRPCDPARERARIIVLRRQLLRACIRYIRAGETTKEQKDRLREASDLSGIPRYLLEVAVQS